MIGVPYRFHKKKLNYHIARFNTKLKNYFKSKLSSFHFIDPNRYLKHSSYARDGIHLNQGAKKLMCEKIKNTLVRNLHDDLGTTQEVTISEKNDHCLPQLVEPDIVIKNKSSTSNPQPHSNDNSVLGTSFINVSVYQTPTTSHERQCSNPNGSYLESTQTFTNGTTHDLNESTFTESHIPNPSRARKVNFSDQGLQILT